MAYCFENDNERKLFIKIDSHENHRSFQFHSVTLFEHQWARQTNQFLSWIVLLRVILDGIFVFHYFSWSLFTTNNSNNGHFDIELLSSIVDESSNINSNRFSFPFFSCSSQLILMRWCRFTPSYVEKERRDGNLSHCYDYSKRTNDDQSHILAIETVIQEIFIVICSLFICRTTQTFYHRKDHLKLMYSKTISRL